MNSACIEKLDDGVYRCRIGGYTIRSTTGNVICHHGARPVLPKAAPAFVSRRLEACRKCPIAAFRDGHCGAILNSDGQPCIRKFRAMLDTPPGRSNAETTPCEWWPQGGWLA